MMQEEQARLLIKDAIKGDDTALMRLFEDQLEDMYETAAMLLGSSEEALETVCSAVMASRKLLSLVNNDYDFSAWVKRRVASTALQTICDRPAMIRTGRDDGFEPTDVPRSFRRHQLPREEFEDLMRQELKSLPDDARVVFVLHDLEGFSLAEVSDLTERTEDEVKDLATAARLALASRLSWVLHGAPQRKQALSAGLKTLMAVANFNC